MSDESGKATSYTAATPWPPVVALGFTLSEVGVILGLRPVSVAGLLLFVVSVAGILTESGYISRPDLAVGFQGLALLGAGVAMVLEKQSGTTIRGQSIIIAAIVSLVSVALWRGLLKSRSLEREPTTELPESADD